MTGIIEALKIVGRAEETAERIMEMAFETYTVGCCEETVVQPNGKVHFLFVYTRWCGYRDRHALDIPAEVLDDPTKEKIQQFVTDYQEAEAQKRKLREDARKTKDADEEKKAKKLRFEEYQRLHAEFATKTEKERG